MDEHPTWPASTKDDDELLDDIFELLKTRANGDPYGADGSFAAALAALPPGLRAMAATHWLDLSLALDSITWHFGNFGEAGLVAHTESGLRELGLQELADCFVEARDLMVPLLREGDGDVDPDRLLERAGLSSRGVELDKKAWSLNPSEGDKSVIYSAWIRYARKHPERVFI